MKAQRYPASIIRVGAVLYSAFGWTDDEGKCHLDLDEWHVRSMQNRTVSKYFGTKRVVISLVQKAEDITWQKDNWLTNFPPTIARNFTRMSRYLLAYTPHPIWHYAMRWNPPTTALSGMRMRKRRECGAMIMK